MSGWLFEPGNFNNPERGQGLSQLLFITRYYPNQELNLFANIEGGYISHWNNQPGELNKNGCDLSFGVGYDVFVNKNSSVTPFMSYSFGRLGSQQFAALTLGIGITQKLCKLKKS